MRWEVDAELNPREKRLVGRLRRGSGFFRFLREVRSELFTDEFQDELATAYKPRGQKPVPPALLAMVTLLQAYTGTGDRDAVIKAETDLLWQLVLGILGDEKAPFGQGSLVRFRGRLMASDLDRRLVDRTVELAKETGGFGWQKLKAALDSSPLWGAGRVEDCWNLIGRAMSVVVDAVAEVTGVPADRIIEEAGLGVLSGSSIKAELDIDWDEPEERHAALQRLLAAAESLREWVTEHAGDRAAEPPLSNALKTLSRVIDQDLEPDPEGGGRRVRRGVARDRMPSIGDPEMRHGRKSKSRVFNGYKRHIARTLGVDLILGAVVLPANVAEYEAAEQLLRDIERHGPLSELKIDRGHLNSPVVPLLRQAGTDVHCKPWPLRNRGRFTKDQFDIRVGEGTVVCPAGAAREIGTRKVVRGVNPESRSWWSTGLAGCRAPAGRFEDSRLQFVPAAALGVCS